MPLPPEVMARVDRIIAYHDASKLVPGQTPDPRLADAALRPSPYRIFKGLPQVVLPTNLLDEAVETLRLMSDGLEVLPQSLINPPHDLKTLASWLYMAAGLTCRSQQAGQVHWLRAAPSAGALYPCEIYVVAFSIDGLEPGLYHFCVKDFSLYRLRSGHDALAQIRRGRPDLEILKTMPGLLLVSTRLCRTAWNFGLRSYRYMAMDAGHQVESLVLAATGLGIRTMVRLHVNDRTTRELIGIAPDAPFDQLEPVQAFIAWAEKSPHPLAPPTQWTPPQALEPLARTAPIKGSFDIPQIVKVHDDCVAPGVGVQEVHPPHTEQSPVDLGSALSAGATTVEFPSASLSDPSPVEFESALSPGLSQMQSDSVPSGSALPLPPSLPLRQAMATRRSVRQFTSHSLSHDQLDTLCHVAFRGGTYYPLFPDGAHMALVRPFWFIHQVSGLTAGLWYYNLLEDRLLPVRQGNLRRELARSLPDPSLGQTAAAVCFMVAQLKQTMQKTSPDVYRLAHIEAGMASHRLYLAATSMKLGCCAIGAFYDDEVRQLLGIAQPGWEVIYGTAIGVPGIIPLP